MQIINITPFSCYGGFINNNKPFKFLYNLPFPTMGRIHIFGKEITSENVPYDYHVNDFNFVEKFLVDFFTTINEYKLLSETYTILIEFNNFHYKLDAGFNNMRLLTLHDNDATYTKSFDIKEGNSLDFFAAFKSGEYDEMIFNEIEAIRLDRQLRNNLN